ncbi:hypothetical protein YSY22_04330 [Brevibacillus formosus]
MLIPVHVVSQIYEMLSSTNHVALEFLTEHSVSESQLNNKRLGTS